MNFTFTSFEAKK